MIKSIVHLIRPHQWLKNLFVFLPLFFGQQLFDTVLWQPVLYAFSAFCFASSGIYCLNDICDAELDKRHAKKRLRPIASGVVSKSCGYMVMLSCWLLSAIFTVLAGIPASKIFLESISIIVIYIVLNVAYCLRLKHYSIVDVFVIAMGFVLRLFLGGVVTGIVLSHWIVLMTFLVALFIAIGKRRDDVVLYEERGVKQRPNIARYNLSFMNQALSIIASIMMVCYVMYTVSEEVIDRIGSDKLYLTSVFVLAGIIRFLQVALVDLKSGSPTMILLKDHFVQLCILGWIGSFYVLLYL